MKKILVINGPNLNTLGNREKSIYGSKSLDDIERECLDLGDRLDIKISFFQSNSESQIIDCIQNSREIYSGLIINAGAYTHTSVAIHDSLKILKIPIIEIHISNPFKREEFRQKSFISPIANGIISGFGTDVYKIGLNAMIMKLGLKNG